MRRALSRLVTALIIIAAPLTGTGLVFLPGVAGASSNRFASEAVVSVSPEAAQTIEGFGASGAWWPNDLAHFPATTQDHVAALLFSRRGIDLSGYRYNIGGGGTGVLNPLHVAPTFLTRLGHYDWAADTSGLRFLRLANQYRVPVLTGFVNSAPAVWTTNGLSCGGRLVPGDEAAYAGYLADVVAHLHSAEGITLSYVSPMNEPDSSFSWCTQEGMAVPVVQRGTVVQAVGEALQQNAPWAHVIADESSQVFFQFLPEAPAWLSEPGTDQWVVALAHHTYDYPSDTLLSWVSSVGSHFHKAMWATEICCYDGARFGQQFDPTITSGLWLAKTIWRDLAVTGDAAFYWWEVASPRMGCDPVVDPRCSAVVNNQGWNDGLLYYDPYYRFNHDYGIYQTKRFWVMGNFSRYVRPGAVRHEVVGVPADVHMLAFQRRFGWSLVAIDDAPYRSQAQTVRVEFPQGAQLEAQGAFSTSATHNLDPVPTPRPEANSAFALDLKPQSVTTFVFRTAQPRAIYVAGRRAAGHKTAA